MKRTTTDPKKRRGRGADVLSPARARVLAAVRALWGVPGVRVSGRSLGGLLGCSRQIALVHVRWLLEHGYLRQVGPPESLLSGGEPALEVRRTPPDDDPVWREAVAEVARAIVTPSSRGRRVDVKRAERREKFLQAVEELTEELGRPPSHSDLAARLGYTRAYVGQLALLLSKEGLVVKAGKVGLKLPSAPGPADPSVVVRPPAEKLTESESTAERSASSEKPRPERPVVQRTYTLRLSGDDDQGNWQRLLWSTHEIFNIGAAAFLDVLLTMRGGLDRRLADALPPGPERAGARAALALGWISPEVRRGSPERFYVADSDVGGSALAALERVLERLEVSDQERESWLQDCATTLGAPLRADAVWVDRSAAFAEFASGLSVEEARADAWRLVESLYGTGYLTPYHGSDDAEWVAVRVSPLSGSGAGLRSRQLFSHLFGRSTSYGQPPTSLNLRQEWADRIAECLAAAGVTLVRERTAGRRLRGEVSSPGELHRAMLRAAAERFAYSVTMQRRQEAARRAALRADSALRELEADPGRSVPLALLDRYRVEMTRRLGSAREFRIRPPQIRGWQRVVDAWFRLAPGQGSAAEDLRARLVHDVQGVDAVYFDTGLLLELARDEARAIWQTGGRPDSALLERYVAGHLARDRAGRLRQPVVVHPDAIHSPLFCTYGTAYPAIEFGRLRPGDDPSAVRLLVWTGERVDMLPLRGASRRLEREVGSASERAPAAQAVARDTAKARAAVGAAPDQPVRAAGVFDDRPVKARKSPEGDSKSATAKSKPAAWSARLVADRRTLKRVASIQATDPQRAERLLGRLSWHLEVPLRLQPRGPFLDYAERHGLRLEMRSGAIATMPSSERDAWRGVAYPFWHPHNAGRSGLAKYQLGRLPGIRVLGARLVGTSRIACAIWEVVDSGEIARASARAGLPAPAANDLWHKAGAVYRRIGPDAIGDGSPHPAPWARLEAQFFVGVDGADDRRLASDEELWSVHSVEENLGVARPLLDRLVDSGFGRSSAQRRRLERLSALGWRRKAQKVASTGRAARLEIDEVILAGIKAVRVALIRQGLRARVAFWMKRAAEDPAVRADALHRALESWSRLRNFVWQPDPWACWRWDSSSAPKLDEGHRGQVGVGAIREIALRFDNAEAEAEAWAKAWEYEDGLVRSAIRAVRQLAFPRKSGRRPGAFHHGGLGRSRFRLLTSYRALVTAYRLRPRPENLTPSAETETQLTAGFARRVTQKLARMRRARLASLASSVVEAALGIGGSRPRPSVHAIVFDDDRDVRGQTTGRRRLGRALRERAGASLRQKIAEGCELHGIHMRVEGSAYRDLFDARTGAPGVRCRDLMPEELLARTSNASGDCPAFEREIVTEHWSVSEGVWKNQAGRWRRTQGRWVPADADTCGDGPSPVRVPDAGGPIFVSSDPRSPTGHGVDAELNAAASLALRPLLDPDWPGSWWFVPVLADVGTLAPGFASGSPALDPSAALLPGAQAGRIRSGAGEAVILAWRDPTAEKLALSVWQPTSHYRAGVLARVVERMREEK